MDPKLVTKQHPVHVWDDEKHHHSASNYVIPQQITSSHSKLRHPTANYVIPQQITSSHSKLRHPTANYVIPAEAGIHALVLLLFILVIISNCYVIYILSPMLLVRLNYLDLVFLNVLKPPLHVQLAEIMYL